MRSDKTTLREKGWNFTSWLFSIILLILGGGALLSDAIIAGLILIFIAVLIMPVTKKHLLEKYNYDLSVKIKSILIVVAFVVLVLSFGNNKNPREKVLSECYTKAKECSKGVPALEDRFNEVCYTMYYYYQDIQTIINKTNNLC